MLKVFLLGVSVGAAAFALFDRYMHSREDEYDDYRVDFMNTMPQTLFEVMYNRQLSLQNELAEVKKENETLHDLR